jgi:FtsP/CotA-like multicopper oxidase with cupredoxin domain
MTTRFTGATAPIDHRRRSLLLGATLAPLAPLVLSAGCGGGDSTALPMMQPVLPPPAPDAPGPFATPGRSLPMLALDRGVVDAAGTRSFSLAVQRASTQFRSGVDTATLGYNGALLGPALRLRAGEKTAIRVRNELAESTTVHWHGLVVPAEVDGGPHQPIAPGGLWQADFTVANTASTCWFHPHPHGATGRQVVSGLAGLLIVDDAAASPSPLPETWGIDDVALVLQDKRFTAAGQIDYALTGGEALTGYSGDHLLVNGAFGPVWQAPRQWVRLRLLNGCNARTLALRLGNSASLLQVANEGGLLAAPVTRASVTLAPGERAEVLVDFSGAATGQEIALIARSVSDGMGMGMGLAMGTGSAASEVTALTIRVALARQSGAIAAPPASLRAAPAVVPGVGAATRSFVLGGGMMGSAFTINGRSFDIGRIDFAPRAGTVEVWQFINATAMAHPMHVHGVRMSLLARDGLAPAAHERGPRDTFVVEAMQTVTVAVQTAALASATPLMLHCHILEHEDAGMMSQFVTV